MLADYTLRLQQKVAVSEKSCLNWLKRTAAIYQRLLCNH